ncbi:hypothetical protein SAMN06266787_12716, partial [Halorubrum ezzemoulense]
MARSGMGIIVVLVALDWLVVGTVSHRSES